MSDKNRIRTRTVRFERLENREMMSGMTASLSPLGVLSIKGTAAAETISLRQQNNQVTIDNVSGAFAVKSIKSISIAGGGGNDTIRLTGLAAAGSAQLKVPITITSVGGNDVLQLANGQDIYFAGLGNIVAVDAAGNATINGQKANWFDETIQSADIRILAKSDFSDGVISRTEMLGVLRQVEKDGALTSVEMTDLQSLVKNASLFSGVAYVQTLAGDIVLGNVANAHYLGGALGNLTVGSSAAQLEKLVDKWFLGADHPLGNSAWGPTYSYQTASGKLFAHAPVYTDVCQGGIGDCYFLSSLAETALREPTVITNMFIVNGDGTYTVKMYDNGKPDYVTVDSQLPADVYGRFVFANMGQYLKSSSNTLWVALAEKAYVQFNEEGWTRSFKLPGYSQTITLYGSGQNAYGGANAGINGGYIGVALSQITGRAETVFASTGGSTSFTAFAQAFQSGCLMGMASFSSPNSASVVGGHAYAVLSVDAKAKTVTLYNPWGINNGSQYPGIVTLTWAPIQTNFAYSDFVAA